MIFQNRINIYFHSKKRLTNEFSTFKNDIDIKLKNLENNAHKTE